MLNCLETSLAAAVALGALQLAAPASVRTYLPFVDAAPILDALKDTLPPDLKGKTLAEQKAAWPGWVSQHDRSIRARVARGDEDSVVNFLLFGTSFTTRPRAQRTEFAAPDGQKTNALIQGRIDDLIAALAAPGTNERLRFVREHVERKGFDPTTSGGKSQIRRYLNDAGTRMMAELAAYRRKVEAVPRLSAPAAELTALSTIYRERGLSSDTSLPPDFALQETLEVMQARHVLEGPVRRIAIIGPGLDFTDKADGYDFYPVQSLQPFAVIDSVIRLGLARLDNLHVHALDLSPRVNEHLEAARRGARAGRGYVVALPLNLDENWNPALLNYWKQFGNSIGAQPQPIVAPANAGVVTVRALEIPAKVVDTILPEDVNIVVQRLVLSSSDEQFDLIIATNILTYYDVFEQSLALANIESMLRPGGFLLSNSVTLPENAFTRSGGAATITYSVREADQIFWYQRRR